MHDGPASGTRAPGACKQASTDLPEQVLLTIPQAQHALGGIARATAYKLINGGQLQTVRIGKRRFVPASDLDVCVARLRGK